MVHWWSSQPGEITLLWVFALAFCATGLLFAVIRRFLFLGGSAWGKALGEGFELAWISSVTTVPVLFLLLLLPFVRSFFLGWFELGTWSFGIGVWLVWVLVGGIFLLDYRRDRRKRAIERGQEAGSPTRRPFG